MAEAIDIYVISSDNSEIVFRIKLTSLFARIAKAYKEQTGINAQFYHQGELLDNTQTIGELGLKNNTYIDALVPINNFIEFSIGHDNVIEKYRASGTTVLQGIIESYYQKYNIVEAIFLQRGKILDITQNLNNLGITNESKIIAIDIIHHNISFAININDHGLETMKKLSTPCHITISELKKIVQYEYGLEADTAIYFELNGEMLNEDSVLPTISQNQVIDAIVF